MKSKQFSFCTSPVEQRSDKSSSAFWQISSSLSPGISHEHPSEWRGSSLGSTAPLLRRNRYQFPHSLRAKLLLWVQITTLLLSASVKERAMGNLLTTLSQWSKLSGEIYRFEVDHWFSFCTPAFPTRKCHWLIPHAHTYTHNLRTALRCPLSTRCWNDCAHVDWMSSACVAHFFSHWASRRFTFHTDPLSLRLWRAVPPNNPPVRPQLALRNMKKIMNICQGVANDHQACLLAKLPE